MSQPGKGKSILANMFAALMSKKAPKADNNPVAGQEVELKSADELTAENQDRVAKEQLAQRQAEEKQQKIARQQLKTTLQSESKQVIVQSGKALKEAKEFYSSDEPSLRVHNSSYLAADIISAATALEVLSSSCEKFLAQGDVAISTSS